MKDILVRLFEHQTFSQIEARKILTDLASGRYNSTEMAAFLAGLCMRPITVEELAGFRDAMLELCIPVHLNGHKVIDLCGTGGDGKHTFNISTLASFVVAGAGYKVAKHGNYGVSSISGSSNVMESMGYRFTSNASEIEESIDKAGICFLHAPLFHPAMKRVGVIRKELGVKTFFNMLGPIVNPARPAYQLTGVFSLELARLYYYLFQQSDRRFSIVHTLDGYDEVSLTGPVKLYSNKGESLLKASYFERTWLKPGEISGGATTSESAEIFAGILEGSGTPAQNEVVCWNAAFAISCITGDDNPHQNVETALESLMGGRAKQKFSQLLAINDKYATGGHA